VRIHESRRERRVTEIDHLRTGGNREIAPGIGNRGSLDNDDAVRDQRLRFAIEKAGRLQDNERLGIIPGAECTEERHEKQTESRDYNTPVKSKHARL
jgi:hypothetical protein